MSGRRTYLVVASFVERNAPAMEYQHIQALDVVGAAEEYEGRLSRRGIAGAVFLVLAGSASVNIGPSTFATIQKAAVAR